MPSWYTGNRLPILVVNFSRVHLMLRACHYYCYIWHQIPQEKVISTSITSYLFFFHSEDFMLLKLKLQLHSKPYFIAAKAESSVKMSRVKWLWSWSWMQLHWYWLRAFRIRSLPIASILWFSHTLCCTPCRATYNFEPLLQNVLCRMKKDCVARPDDQEIANRLRWS